MDDFEKFIKDNKEHFDNQKADKAKLWANIESRLEIPKPKIVKLWQRPIAQIAALVVVALGIFSMVNFFGFQNNVGNNNVVSQELNDIDAHYKGLVAYQVKLVNNSTHLTSNQKKEFLSFMDELDNEYDILKLELQNNLDNERVLEAIVINYKKRIELIENLLSQINRSKIAENDDVYVL